MTYQTNPCFEHVDNLEGCCLFASAHAILDLCDALDQFTDDNMLAWLSKAKALGDIIADDFLQFPQAWSDIITGVPGKVLYLDRILPAGFSEQALQPSIIFSTPIRNSITSSANGSRADMLL